MCDQENGIGFADHPVPHFNVTSMPVGQPSPHHSHAQLGIIGVVELPIGAYKIIITHTLISAQYLTTLRSIPAFFLKSSKIQREKNNSNILFGTEGSF